MARSSLDFTSVFGRVGGGAVRAALFVDFLNGSFVRSAIREVLPQAGLSAVSTEGSAITSPDVSARRGGPR